MLPGKNAMSWNKSLSRQAILPDACATSETYLSPSHATVTGSTSCYPCGLLSYSYYKRLPYT